MSSFHIAIAGATGNLGQSFDFQITS
ncbi:hypothetical protein CLIM01_04999 [Colletotrichum limetticola]|uniref:Uncharacterized protein n=1 Tax=Colletotrichum limetticola TaxID=1209924 RepID=A0ABQ9Q1I1_9PEZI|nr:hypothetical protein CLIM01_04999 [Colletotrichum limetticola]